MSKSKRKEKRILKRQIQKILAKSLFNPSEPGPIKVICDVSNDPKYFITRAVEVLSYESNDPQWAISLLAIAIAKKELLSQELMQLNI